MPKTWKYDRAFARVPARMTATIKTSSKEISSCPVHDVGFGGLYVDHCLDENAACMIEIRFAEFPEVAPVRAEGRVVRVDPDRGSAIMFTEMPLELFDRLDEFMLMQGSDGHADGD